MIVPSIILLPLLGIPQHLVRLCDGLHEQQAGRHARQVMHSWLKMERAMDQYDAQQEEDSSTT